MFTSITKGLLGTTMAECNEIHDCLSKNPTCLQTEIHLISPALYNYACSLPLLANVNWSAFPECLLPNHVNSHLVKWHQWRAPIWQWGPDVAPTVNASLSRPYGGILAHCGYMYTSQSPCWKSPTNLLMA